MNRSATLESQELNRSFPQVITQRRTLDYNGMRYLVSLRAFTLGINNPKDLGKDVPQASRLHFRDVVWAFHSQSQDVLVEASVETCKGRMTWDNARALGLALWLKSPATLVSSLCLEST
jgi:hypothetical protein